MAQSHGGSARMLDGVAFRTLSQGSSFVGRQVSYAGGIALLVALYYGAAHFG